MKALVVSLSALVLVACGGEVPVPKQTDFTLTDSTLYRGAFAIIDRATGCEYIIIKEFDNSMITVNITPRLDSNGKIICKPTNRNVSHDRSIKTSS